MVQFCTVAWRFCCCGPGGTTTATYTHGNALIRKDGETPLFDGLGSERTVTNSSQAVTASLTLSAFGQTVASTGSSTSAYQFGATSGYRTEGDAGLTLVGCRFYDAQVGRFITGDTDLDEAPYTYCDGDPVNVTNSSGHIGIVFGTVGAGVTIAVTFLAVVAIEIISGGAATPIVLAVVSGALGGTAGGATTAAIDGTDIAAGALEGGIIGGATAGTAPILERFTKVVTRMFHRSGRLL